MTVLALKYRPRSFGKVLGQPHITPVLRSMVRRDEVASSYVFAGTSGTGKTTAARIFAAALNCSQASEGDACGECDSCIEICEGRSHLVLEIDAASTGGVADVEKIREVCLHTPTSAWRVVIIDEAHAMSREAYNALLKLLEEPPTRTVFVLATTEPQKILKTVKSRSLPFQFRPVAPADVANFLWDIAGAEEFVVEPQLCVEIAMRTQGHVRDAVMALDSCRMGEVSTREAYLRDFVVPDVSLDLLTALSQGSLVRANMLCDQFLAQCADAEQFVVNLTRALTSVLSAVAGGDEVPQAMALTQVWGRDRLFDSVRLMWDFADRYKISADPRTQVRLVVSRLAVALDVEFVQEAPDAAAVFGESGLLRS